MRRTFFPVHKALGTSRPESRLDSGEVSFASGSLRQRVALESGSLRQREGSHPPAVGLPECSLNSGTHPLCTHYAPITHPLYAQ